MEKAEYFTFIVPAVITFILLYAWSKKVQVFPVFLEGAEKGLHTALSILPTLIGLLTAVTMLRASGAVDALGELLAPLFSLLGIPKECTALVLLKPISGSGGLAMGSEIMKTYGPDSYAGRVAAVMLGASETSLYTISIYSGFLKLKNLKYAVPAALVGDLVAFVLSAYFVRLQFGVG